MRFAFTVHPIHPKDAARKYPWMRFLPGAALEGMIRRLPVKVAGRITGLVSKTGVEAGGVFIGIPRTPRQMMADPEGSLALLRRAVEVARDEGCSILGLGAYTAIVGDGGQTLAADGKIAVTTGNSYTVATAIEWAMTAA
ncbi:MAG: hypothetical protein MH204_00710, partial [Fimbriimonadaceae bacterium]|nr:hypothetical protein [Fimbriimonadaceae bacterium]